MLLLKNYVDHQRYMKGFLAPEDWNGFFYLF